MWSCWHFGRELKAASKLFLLIMKKKQQNRWELSKIFRQIEARSIMYYISSAQQDSDLLNGAKTVCETLPTKLRDPDKVLDIFEINTSVFGILKVVFYWEREAVCIKLVFSRWVLNSKNYCHLCIILFINKILVFPNLFVFVSPTWLVILGEVDSNQNSQILVNPKEKYQIGLGLLEILLYYVYFKYIWKY